jgi:hypothetical protein
MVNCTIRNVFASTNFGQMQGILLNQIGASRFDYNYFTGNGKDMTAYTEAYALIAHAVNATSFSHNTLYSTHQGFHFESSTMTGGNGLVVSYNRVWNLRAIGIEFNRYTSNATVEGNILSNWRSGDATGCSTCNIGLEAASSNSTFRGNQITGFLGSVVVACAPGSTFTGNIIGTNVVNGVTIPSWTL